MLVPFQSPGKPFNPDRWKEIACRSEQQEKEESSCVVAKRALAGLTPLNVPKLKPYQPKQPPLRKATNEQVNVAIILNDDDDYDYDEPAQESRKGRKIVPEVFTFSDAHLQLSQNGVPEGQRFRYRAAPAWAVGLP